MNDLQFEFNKLARSGYLGDPGGLDAYAYLRASTERQVEEGSSFPRQLESVHKAAQREGLRIPFELIFFDDGFTGFEFEHRPALLKFRYEVQAHPRANHLVIEDIDRLSRNADWQQGFLLEEFIRRHIEVHFYIHPGSQLERYVRGYIAQEGMKKDIERMRMGNLYKAMDGKVTARRPRYGYIKTHPQNTHYALHPEESTVMRMVYDRIIYKGWTLAQVAHWLNETNVPTRFKNGYWSGATIYNLVTDPIYSGSFCANRYYAVKTGEFNEKGKPKKVMRMRPESEWIRIEVPAIVTPEEWSLAQEIMARNRSLASKNGDPWTWLLSGLLKCELCPDYSYGAKRGGTPKSPHRYYHCRARTSEKALMQGVGCDTPYVRAEVLEDRIWAVLEGVIYDPTALIKRLEEKGTTGESAQYQEQIDFIDKQLTLLAREREKYEAAYQRDIYTLDEFVVKVNNVREKAQKLTEARAKLDSRLAEVYSLEDQKQVVFSALAKIRAELERARRAGGQPDEIPFELKRKILSLLVKVIWINGKEKTFTIEGEIKGTFSFAESDDHLPPATPAGNTAIDFISGQKSRVYGSCP